MQTVSVSIENLCVPCQCGCRHCLLESRHCSTGIEYSRSQAFAKRFYDWMRENRPELGGNFYVGYCNEFPELPEHISFVQQYLPDFHFLQFNGMKFRDSAEIRELLRSVMDRGIRLIDLTFYGTKEYHDRFAGRRGDFAYLLRILREADRLGLAVVASIVLTEENALQMDALFTVLEQYAIAQYSVFLPHAKGRGFSLSHSRLTEKTYANLPEIVKERFMKVPHKTEREWLSQPTFPIAEKRALTLSLTPENIDRLEAMDPAEIIGELEVLDDTYYASLPSVNELARLCGRPENPQLFRFRDLVLEWQKRYIQAKSLEVYDMNDERHSFSTRIYPNR